MENESEVCPTAIQRTERGIRITWSDDHVTEWTTAELRASCPCATCREKHSPSKPKPSGKPSLMTLPVLSAAETRPLLIEAMRPVGTYAYNIAFSDGHSSGLFTFGQLRNRADETVR